MTGRQFLDQRLLQGRFERIGEAQPFPFRGGHIVDPTTGCGHQIAPGHVAGTHVETGCECDRGDRLIVAPIRPAALRPLRGRRVVGVPAENAGKIEHLPLVFPVPVAN